MSYFKAQPGKRPEGEDQPAAQAPGGAPAEQPQPAPEQAAKPPRAFGGGLGGRPEGAPPPRVATGGLRPTPATARPATPRAFGGALGQAVAPAAPGEAPPAALPAECPLCRGGISEERCVEGDGLWRCAGRCGSRWLREAGGPLVALSALPYGVCGCCAAPRALVGASLAGGAVAGAIVCPASGRRHLLLKDGGSAPIDRFDAGLCLCCVPAQPLARLADRVVCPGHPERPYALEGGRWVPAQTLGGAETLAAIDAALRANTAKVTLNGLFDLD